jgi:hypothetical protein
MTLKEANEWVSTVKESWKSETAANWAVTEGGGLVGRVSLRTMDLEDGWRGSATGWFRLHRAVA